ncbi:hypothetical protein NQZ68_028243 [Dissostichus eleginoides]|nr:hypothetical protein NQZ68_028243 [Dissostichus eleginoides]
MEPFGLSQCGPIGGLQYLSSLSPQQLLLLDQEVSSPNDHEGRNDYVPTSELRAPDLQLSLPSGDQPSLSANYTLAPPK